MIKTRMWKQCVLGLGATGLVVAVALATAQPSGWQDNKTQQEKQMSQQGMQSSSLETVRTTKLIGQKVKDKNGESIGTIYDLVLAPDGQEVSYVALSSGGLWGIGNTLYAVPWSALQPGMRDTCTLDVTRNQLRSIGGFKEDEWPSSPSAQWTSMKQGSMMQPSQHQQRRNMGMENRSVQRCRVTKLTGMEVRNYEDQDIGDIEGFVITMDGTGPSKQGSGQQSSSPSSQSKMTGETQTQSGHVLYTVVSLGGFLGLGEKYALVPAEAVNLQTQKEYVRLDTDENTLKAIAFAPDKWPDLSSRSYAQQIYKQFDEQPYWTVLGYMGSAQTQSAVSQKAWAAGSDYNRNFDAKTVKSIEGTIESVGTFQPATGIRQGLRLRVKTDDGKTITVYAGPQWYAQQKDFSVKAGDKIKVTGSQTQVRNRSVIMATKVESGGTTLELRSDDGQPKWKEETKPSQESQNMGG